MSMEMISEYPSLFTSAISTPMLSGWVCIITLAQLFFKGAIMLIDVQVIVLMKIVPYVDVRIPIQVDVRSPQFPVHSQPTVLLMPDSWSPQ